MNFVKGIERPLREGELAKGTDGNRRRVFFIQCDSKKATPEFVVQHPIVPRPYDSYNGAISSLKSYYATRFSARQFSNHPYAWEVTVHYEPLAPGDGENPNDPSSRIPKYTWGSWEERQIVKKDSDGKRFLNGAKQPLEEAPEFPRMHRALTVVRAQRTFNAPLMDSYNQTVCIHSFGGYPTGTACMWDITATYEFDAELGFYFAWVTYEIRFRNVEVDPLDNWKWRPRNCGFEYKETAESPKVTTFKELDGSPVVLPRDLAADGTKLADDAEVNYLRFRIREFSNWSALGISPP